MKMEGIVLLGLGAVFIVFAGINASKAPNVSYLVGTFLPGLVCLILGLKLGQTKKTKLASHAERVDSEAAASDLEPGRLSVQGDNTRSNFFQLHANVGVGCGILLMFVGSAVAQGVEGGLLVGSLISFAGWAGVIWGCVNYMRWKGHAAWFGLFGYLLLPGLIILVALARNNARNSRTAATLVMEAHSTAGGCPCVVEDLAR